jgi:hypothetical protein
MHACLHIIKQQLIVHETATTTRKRTEHGKVSNMACIEHETTATATTTTTTATASGLKENQHCLKVKEKQVEGKTT